MMNASGISYSVMVRTDAAFLDAGVDIADVADISEIALASISMMAPAGVNAATTLNTPALVAGAAVVSGVPI